MHDEKDVRVVLADDENHVRLLMKRIVLGLGYTVVGEAADGQKALELYEKEQPDLLLLDIKMPIMNGDEVLEEIMKQHPEACVIIMTSKSDSDSVKKCIKLGATNYILKSPLINEIRIRIKESYTKFIQKRKTS